ncbi:MAG: GNAT family N-acetyltransferase [Clostridia bacterium]|nr:GNAT family N-acetyltransferase [Clostridia bacterium]
MSDPMLCIDRAGERDIPEMLRILREVGAVHAEGRPDKFKAGACKYDDAALRVILADDDQPVFCVRDGENLLATAYLQIRRVEENSVLCRRLTVYVDDFCVSSESRGQHVGTHLMEHVIDYAREIGADNILLNVYEFNTAALRFYESLGMTTESRHMELAL